MERTARRLRDAALRSRYRGCGKKIGELTRAGKLLSVAGGGDTVAALAVAEVMHELSYVSTAGGAFLEWLEGRELPGVTALAPSGTDR
jgi:phosphoglycerate kinase